MSNPKFLVTLTQAQKNDIFGHIDAIEAILNFRVNLTPKQRKEKCKMGTKNYGKVKNVHDAAMAVPDAIPAAYPIADFSTRMVLNDDMHLIANRINSLAESVDDTRLLLRSKLMDDKAVFYRLLKIAAKENLPVEAILEKLLADHKKKPYAKPIEYTIAPKGKVIIENVATGRKLVNTGNSVVMLRPSAGLTVNQRDAKLIDPESSVVVPKGWTSIEVLNQSETSDAVIAVRLKQ